MRIKYTIIDLVGNLESIKNLKKNMNYQSIPIFNSIDDYLSDNHMKIDKNIKTFQDLFYDEYMHKTEVLIIITDISKKQWRKFTKSINEDTFYPIKKIRIMSDYSNEKVMLKIKNSLELTIDKFYDKYNQLLTTLEDIKICPYCRSNKILFIDEVKEIEEKQKKDKYYIALGWFGDKVNCASCQNNISGRWRVHLSEFSSLHIPKNLEDFSTQDM